MHAHRPADLSALHVIRFFLDHCAEHPLWLADGLPDLDTLCLPTDLRARLRRWAEHWNSRYDWQTRWEDGYPEPWWLDEQARLPRDVATAVGPDFAVAAEGGFLRSDAPAASPQSAEALRAFVAEWQRTRAAARHPGRCRLTAGR